MQITNGQQYTFSFIPTGTYMDIGSLADDAIQQLQNASFPITAATGETQGVLGGIFGGNTISITFTYTGSDTDDASFGNAMATELTNDFTLLSFAYNGSTAGPAPNPSLIDKAKAALGVTTGGSGQGTPSVSTIGIVLVGVLLLGVAVYSFAGAAGHEAAARV